jgi:hypothetical protein
VENTKPLVVKRKTLVENRVTKKRSGLADQVAAATSNNNNSNDQSISSGGNTSTVTRRISCRAFIAPMVGKIPKTSFWNRVLRNTRKSLNLDSNIQKNRCSSGPPHHDKQVFHVPMLPSIVCNTICITSNQRKFCYDSTEAATRIW